MNIALMIIILLLASSPGARSVSPADEMLHAVNTLQRLHTKGDAALNDAMLAHIQILQQELLRKTPQKPDTVDVFLQDTVGDIASDDAQSETKTGAVQQIGPNGTEPPSVWRYCSDESGSCRCKGRIRFGYQAAKFSKTLASMGTAAVNCIALTFGTADPAPGYRKHCECDGKMGGELPPIPLVRPSTNFKFPTGIKVSITIPTITERCDFFARSMVRNMQRSSYPSHLLELLILNSGTTNCSVPADTRIRYIWHDLNREKKLELGSARNLLTKKATGDVIVVMDDDDLYGEDYIPFMVQHLYSDPRLLLINMKRYLGIQVQSDGAALFQRGNMGTGVGATFVFKRSVGLEKEGVNQCWYPDNTGEEDNGLWSCVGNFHETDYNHGGFAVGQADPGNQSSSVMYLKMAWALSTTMKTFKNKFQTAEMGFRTGADANAAHLASEDYSAVKHVLSGSAKKTYMARVAEHMAALDLMLSKDRPIDELLKALVDACVKGGDTRDFRCLNVS